MIIAYIYSDAAPHFEKSLHNITKIYTNLKNEEIINYKFQNK